MRKRRMMRWKIYCTLLLCVLMPWTAVMGEANVDSSQEVPITQSRSQIVRVKLSRLGLTTRVDLVLDGIYGLGAHGESSMLFERGSKLTFVLEGSMLILFYEGMRYAVGSQTVLSRYQAEDEKENGLRISGEEALYEGDLQLDVDGDVIRPILHIHVEEYLCGVVAYEMAEHFPLEALKAQAVTARTYALRRQDVTKAYDLTDTPNDQVYRGRQNGHQQAERAVQETRGICGFFKDELAHCFYGASNGGQTDLVQNVWGGSGEGYGYYRMVDDPYDLENPQSLVRVARITKNPNGKVQEGFREVVATAIVDELKKKGFDTAPESVRIDEILAMSLAKPAFAEPSRLMTALNVTLRYSGRTRTEPTPAPITYVDGDKQEVSLFANDEAGMPGSPSVSSATPAPTPTHTPSPVYGEFESVEKPITAVLPLFTGTGGARGAVAALALGLNGTSHNEMITLEESPTEFVLYSRRYGHGVGMSQRGAEWMAYRYGKSFLDILNFYYPGMDIRRLPESDTQLKSLSQQELQTPGPPPTPTPRPTLMPSTGDLPEGAWWATVTEIADDSSLNLRAAPDLSADIAMRLFKNQRLMVLGRCPEEGWVKVKTDAVEGYVMEMYLTKE